MLVGLPLSLLTSVREQSSGLQSPVLLLSAYLPLWHDKLLGPATLKSGFEAIRMKTGSRRLMKQRVFCSSHPYAQ